MTHLCRVCGFNRDESAYVHRRGKVIRVCTECRAQGWPTRERLECGNCGVKKGPRQFRTGDGPPQAQCRRCREQFGGLADDPEVLRNLARELLKARAELPPECEPVVEEVRNEMEREGQPRPQWLQERAAAQRENRARAGRKSRVTRLAGLLKEGA